MPSVFPGALDSFVDPLITSPLNSPSHAGQHQDINDAVEKVEQYMGLVKVIPTGATNGTVSATGTVTVGNAVSSITISGVFSALYDNYQIVLTGGAGSTAQSINMTLGASTTGYYAGYVSTLYASDTLGYIRNNNSASWDIGGSYPNGNHLNVYLFNPFGTMRTGMNNLGRVDYRTNGAGHISGSGFHDVSASYSAFTLSVAGTMTGGTIRVYGYRN